MATATCKAAVKAEFDKMLAQVFPYTEDGKKAAVLIIIENMTVNPFTIYKNGTTYKFTDYPTVIFYPVIDADYTLQPVIPPDPQDPNDPGTPGEKKSFLFMTDYTGALTITSASTGALYTNGVQATTEVSITHGDVYSKDNGQLYYFCFRMTSIFAEVINNSNISDPGTGQEQGRGVLKVSEAMIMETTDFGASCIIPMQTVANPTNSMITGTLDNTSGPDGYLDYLTGDYFQGNIGSKYHYNAVKDMADSACADLDDYAQENPSKSSATMNDISAQLVANVLDYYCNGDLS